MSKIVTTDGEYETKDLFKKIKSQLEGENFCEVHASYCVNFSYVCGYSSTEVICQHNGRRYKIEMSKRKSPIFKKNFARWSGGIV